MRHEKYSVLMGNSGGARSPHLKSGQELFGRIPQRPARKGCLKLYQSIGMEAKLPLLIYSRHQQQALVAYLLDMVLPMSYGQPAPPLALAQLLEKTSLGLSSYSCIRNIPAVPALRFGMRWRTS